MKPKYKIGDKLYNKDLGFVIVVEIAPLDLRLKTSPIYCYRLADSWAGITRQPSHMILTVEHIDNSSSWVLASKAHEILYE